MHDKIKKLYCGLLAMLVRTIYHPGLRIAIIVTNLEVLCAILCRSSQKKWLSKGSVGPEFSKLWYVPSAHNYGV